MRPFNGVGCVAVFYRVVMDVCDVVFQVSVVSDGVFPISGLPYVVFAVFTQRHGCAGVCKGSAEMAFDRAPALSVIDISGWQGPYGMQMFGKNNHRINLKRPGLSGVAYRNPEQVDMRNQ